MSSTDPQTAREAFLATLNSEEAVKVLLRAEKSGPYPEDNDWVLALASANAAAKIEAAVANSALHFDSAVARMEEATKAAARVESAVARLEAESKRAQTLFQEKEAQSETVFQPSRGHSPGGMIGAFALAMASFAAIVYLVERFPASHVYDMAIYGMAIAVGAGGTALYAKVAPYLIKPSGRRR